MAWEKRRNGSYFYLKRREGDRVVSEYMGTDLLGRLYEAQIYERRAKKARERIRLLSVAAELDELEAKLEKLSEAIETCVTAELVAAGCYRHNREWRRRRKEPAGAGVGTSQGGRRGKGGRGGRDAPPVR